MHAVWCGNSLQNCGCAFEMAAPAASSTLAQGGPWGATTLSFPPGRNTFNQPLVGYVSNLTGIVSGHTLSPAASFYSLPLSTRIAFRSAVANGSGVAAGAYTTSAHATFPRFSSLPLSSAISANNQYIGSHGVLGMFMAEVPRSVIPALGSPRAPQSAAPTARDRAQTVAAASTASTAQKRRREDPDGRGDDDGPGDTAQAGAGSSAGAAPSAGTPAQVATPQTLAEIVTTYMHHWNAVQRREFLERAQLQPLHTEQASMHLNGGYPLHRSSLTGLRLTALCLQLQAATIRQSVQRQRR